MKKFLFVLLSLAVVGAAFAADAAPSFVISGVLKTGIDITMTDAEGVKDAVQIYNDDAGKPSRLEIVGTYTDKDNGVKFRLREDTGLGAAAPLVSYAYAWSNFYNGMFTVKAGNVDDGSWNTDGDKGFDFADGKGIQLQVKAIKGLNFGVKFDVKAASSTTSQFLGETAIAGEYVSDLFNAQLGYKMDSNVDDAAITTGGLDVKAEDNSLALFGFNFKGVKNLKAVLEGQASYLGAYSDVGFLDLVETIEYTAIPKVTVGLIMYQNFPNLEDADTSMDFNPYVNYALNDKLTINGDLYYLTKGDKTDMYIMPGATYAFSSKAKVDGMLKYDISNSGVSGADDVTATSVKIDFIYSF